mmetsp:Transcript_30359/g.66469  ORF Transcript_30359/g.66469 Transcript_30359/m.66469 type:complete len:453 (-) Transcript_30359:57-1415(-)
MTAPLELTEEQKDADASKREFLKAVKLSTFQSVLQHVITLQSEPLLIKQLCNGDVSEAARLLANTSGIVGVASLILNQAGGKISDSVGRRPGFLLGPACNAILGALVFRNPGNRRLVLLCRCIRMVFTTFSNTVIGSAMIADRLSGKALAVAMSEVGTIIGLGVITGPVLESVILARSNNNPRSAYLAMSLMASFQTIYNILCVPETLDVAKRAAIQAVCSLETLNPFGFVNILTRGSSALRKGIAVVTLQMCLEGKNMSDTSQIWMREHLKFSIADIRNFTVCYGSCCAVAGAKITPYFLRTLSAGAFTSFANMTTALAFVMRGALEKSWWWYLSILPMLPGVNGSSAMAMKALTTDWATSEGFGKGEFSAWSNNLRALAGAAAPFVLGNYYAWARRRGVPAGSVFIVAALMGALLPELVLRQMSKQELKSAAEKELMAKVASEPLAVAST